MSENNSVSATSLEEKIKKELLTTHTEIQDMSGGCGQAYSCIIVSPIFEKKSALARHRLINTTLKEEISIIHAWSAKCYTPTEWTELQEKEQQN